MRKIWNAYPLEIIAISICCVYFFVIYKMVCN